MMLRSMKRCATVAIALGTALTRHTSAALAAYGHDGHGRGHRPHCDRVEGKAVWTLIPSPNDPLGRVLGPATGDLKAAVSSYLTSLGPQPDGTLKATSVETWVLGAQDVITFDGVATFTPFGTEGNVRDALTVSGGSGDFAGATGQLDSRHRLFSVRPAPAVASSTFATGHDLHGLVVFGFVINLMRHGTPGQ